MTVTQSRKLENHATKQSTTADANEDSNDDKNTESKSFVSYVQNNVHSLFSNVKVYMKNQQRYSSN